jgi:hypothetical protein
MLNIELSLEEEIKLFKEELRRFFTKERFWPQTLEISGLLKIP